MNTYDMYFSGKMRQIFIRISLLFRAVKVCFVICTFSLYFTVHQKRQYYRGIRTRNDSIGIGSVRPKRESLGVEDPQEDETVCTDLHSLISEIFKNVR